MNFLIGKIGRSIYFDKDNWSIYAGDEEAPLLYNLLAKRFPQHNFYLIGKSDILRTKNKIKNNISVFFDDNDIIENIPSNIIYLFDEHKKSEPLDTHVWLENKINKLNLKFDCGIIFQGPSGQVNIPNKGTKKIKSNEIAKSLVIFENYAAPILHILNITQTPYFLLCSDPRYIPLKQRDVFNDEKIILSQINYMCNAKRILDYENDNLRNVKLNYVNSHIETIFLLNEKKIDFRKIKKTNKFILALNGGGERESIIKEWILPYNEFKIYGKWNENFIKEYSDRFEEKGISEIKDKFWDSRYTFIPPFMKKYSNFVTQKFWKMIYFGIIPFFHPQYDTDKIFPVPEILRLTKPNELIERINYLDNNPIEYNKILNSIYELLDDKYFNGNFIMKLISENVYKCIQKEI